MKILITVNIVKPLLKDEIVPGQTIVCQNHREKPGGQNGRKSLDFGNDIMPVCGLSLHNWQTDQRKIQTKIR